MFRDCLKFPQLLPQIYKLARFRPQRQLRADLVYYYGPPGTGKSTSIHRLLSTVRKLYPPVDYYIKLGGLAKFWDGYDNQHIIWIDDPVSPSVLRTGNEEPVQRLKTVTSTGEVLMEVKCGSMVFDSPLIIISCNLDPRDKARACGIENEDAMYRCFTDTCGTHCIESKRDGRDRIVDICYCIL